MPEPKHLDWSTDLLRRDRAVRAATPKTGKFKPIFVDFTGVTCTNCSYNENTVFPQPKVRDLLDKYERVQLYTDWVPAERLHGRPRRAPREAEGRANRKFKIDAFGTDQLPALRDPRSPPPTAR